MGCRGLCFSCVGVDVGVVYLPFHMPLHNIMPAIINIGAPGGMNMEIMNIIAIVSKSLIAVSMYF